MTQVLVKLDSFDGSNYTRWADKVKLMLMVWNLTYVMDDNLEPIPKNPIPEAQEERTNKYLVPKYLRLQMIDDKPILEQVYELQVLVNKMNSLSIPIVEIFQVGVIIDKLPPSWKHFSKRMMHKFEYYSLDDMLKHLKIEEEARNRDKKSKTLMNVNDMQAGGKGKGKFKFGGHSKKWNLGPQRNALKRQEVRPPTTANAVDDTEELVANLTMYEIDMLDMTQQIHFVN
ncbi:hypothetical protein OSB04_014754 [Centaurea solstitialis]|uniref:Uncharacterized protein n=1 Tax=Centaurea solstitialis TaxID=347529 RepID=A0AA38SXP3_9ASTR|nr:hypothetical protein OSB04_014754 [Centaurea solstitialis]